MCRSLVKFVVETRCYCNQWKIGIIKWNVSDAIMVIYNKARPYKCNQCGHIYITIVNSIVKWHAHR